MIKRADLEDRELKECAPYAAKAKSSRGRVFPEKEHEFRTAFQRDRDRVIHSTAFRRLEYKTQVFVNHEGDHYRTRLTHSLEVSQIARTIARVLRLNEDLTEVISLAHDLGHGPFGHAGEQALSEKMKGHGGFDHNVQSLRIVEVLEDSYPDFPGLNLSREVLNGMKKHGGQTKGGKKTLFPQLLEAQLADIADEIAYDSHDVEDGLRSGLITVEDLSELQIWKQISAYIHKKYASLSENHSRRLAIRLLINNQTQDLIHQTQKNLSAYKIQAFADVESCEKRIVEFSKEMNELKKPWRRLLMTKLYHHYKVVRNTTKGERLVRALFDCYMERPDQLPPSVTSRFERDGIARAICDYIAGMTDRFAQDDYRRLFEPHDRV